MKITFFVLFAAILFSFACNDSDQGSRAASIPPKPALPSDAPTSRPDVRVAILPLVNASQRWVDQNELLRESFPVALGAILQSSTAVELTSRELIKQRMDALNITRNDSVPDKSLIELAGQLNVQYLISWEPDQDKDLNPFLRVRLISSKEKKIVYLNEFPSGANVALFITFLNLYRDALLPAAEDLLERIAPGAEFMPAHLAPQLAQQHAAEALQDVAFALSLQHPSKDRRELEAHAYALATVALLYDSNNTLAREAMAFGAYVNGLYGQSLATLQSMQKDNSLSTSARGLLSLLQGDPPPVNAPGGVVRDSVNAALLHAVQAKHYAHGWQSDTASSEHLHSIYFLRDAFSATGDSWIKKTDAAVGMGLPQIQTEVALIALGSPSHEPYRLNPREYLLGRGDLAERLAKAMNATREDQPTSSSVALRDVMRVRSIRMGLALAEEAWLSAWDFARVQPAEVEYAEEAFSYAAQAYPSSAAILTEKARFYDAIAPDPKKRSEALSAARAADPGYVPAAQMAAELRAPSIKPQERIPAFEQVRALSPFNADLILWTAKHVAQSGAYGRAQSLINQAEAVSAINPRPRIALYDLLWRHRLQVIDAPTVEALLKEFPVSPELQLAAARIHYQNRRADAAESIARRLATQFPSNADAAFLLADAELYASRHEDAIKTLQAFLKVNETPLERLQAMKKHAQILELAGERQRAVAAWKEAAEYAPEDELTRLSYALALKTSNQPDEALTIMLELCKSSIHARAALEAGHILLEQGKPEEALQLAQAAQKAQPLSPWGYKLEADIKIAQGNARQGFEAMAQLARKNQVDAFVDLAGARVLNSIKRYDQAASSAQQGLALRDAQATPPLLKELAKTALESKKLALASNVFDQLAHIHFDDPESLILLARRSIAEDQPDRAKQYLEQALRINPANEEAKKLNRE